MTDAPTPREVRVFVREASPRLSSEENATTYVLETDYRQLERELAAKEVDALIYQSKIHDRDDCILLLKAELAAKEAELKQALAGQVNAICHSEAVEAELGRLQKVQSVCLSGP